MRISDYACNGRSNRPIAEKSQKALATTEPAGISRNGNYPNELTLLPWIRGQNLMWDVTCVEKLTSTHMRKPV